MTEYKNTFFCFPKQFTLPAIPSNLPKPIEKPKSRYSAPSFVKTLPAKVDFRTVSVTSAPKALCPSHSTDSSQLQRKMLPRTEFQAVDNSPTVVYIFSGTNPCPVFAWHIPTDPDDCPSPPIVTKLPHRRRLHASAYLQGRFYVAGGLDERHKCVRTFWSYDAATSHDWYAERPLPLPVHSCTLLAAHSHLFAFGGDCADDVRRSSTANGALHRYDPVRKEWTELRAMRVPRSGAAVTRHRNWIVVAGGRDATGEVLRSVEAYDLLMDDWQSWPEMPLARAMASACSVAADATAMPRLCVTGGLDGGGAPMDGVDVLECLPDRLQSEQWVSLGRMECARFGHAVVVVGAQLVIVGGRNRAAKGQDVAEVLPVECFCLKRRAWIGNVAELPNKLVDFSVATLEE